MADCTYVPMAMGSGYTALVIDAFAGLIVGWECSLSKHTAFVESAIRQATALRSRQGHPLTGARSTIAIMPRFVLSRGIAVLPACEDGPV